MARKEYNNLDELFGDLENDITNSMLTSVDKAVKKVYKRNVDKMYNSYNPTYYQRRMENEGFGDKDNWQSSVDCAGDTFEYVMTNETLANGDNRGNRLDTYIEEGIYNWKRHPGKREVYSNSQDELDSSNEVENAIYKDLKEWF